MDMSRTPAVAHIDDVLHIVEKIGALDPAADAQILKHLRLALQPKADNRLIFFLQGAENIAIFSALVRSPAFLGKKQSGAFISPEPTADSYLLAINAYLTDNPDIAARLECTRKEWEMIANRMTRHAAMQPPYPRLMREKRTCNL